jgi:hypothetical protein
VSKVLGLYGDVVGTRFWVAATSRKRRWRGIKNATEQDRTA